jgi:hypothetical protein
MLTGSDRPADRRQPVLGIIPQEVARPVFQAQGHVAIRIVAGCQGFQPDHEAQRAILGHQLSPIEDICTAGILYQEYPIVELCSG